MASRKVKYERNIYWRVTELGELFFYALYGFKAYWAIGIIQPMCATKIKQQIGINLSNYDIKLRTDELIHFLYSHFTETNKKQRGIHFNDIEKLYEVVNYFNEIKLGNRPDTLLFIKNYPNNDSFELVIEINNAKKTLLGKSFRIKT